MPEDYETLKQQGEEALAKEDFALALQCFEKALVLAPEEAEAHSNLGKVFAQLKQLEKAKVFFEKALEIDPSNVLAMNNRSLVYLRQGDPQSALQLAHKALQSSPDTAIIYTTLGNIYLDLGDKLEAESLYRKAISLDENCLPVKFNLAMFFIQENRFDEAGGLLEELLNSAFHSKRLAILINLSSIYLKQSEPSRFKRVIELLEEALLICQGKNGDSLETLHYTRDNKKGFLLNGNPCRTFSLL